MLALDGQRRTVLGYGMAFTGRLSIRLPVVLLHTLEMHRARIAADTGLRVTLADAARKLLSDAIKARSKTASESSDRRAAEIERDKREAEAQIVEYGERHLAVANALGDGARDLSRSRLGGRGGR